MKQLSERKKLKLSKDNAQLIFFSCFYAFFLILFVISYQEDVIDIMVNALEKFAWASTEIATHMKVGNIPVT